MSGGYDMSIPRFSPIDDDAQVLNEDEYDAGYQARQEVVCLRHPHNTLVSVSLKLSLPRICRLDSVPNPANRVQ